MALPGLDGEHTPESEEYGIRSFVYRARRPFHPTRFADFIEGEWPGVLRSKGFAWIATRSDWVMLWSQAGATCSLDAGAQWWAAVPADEWPDDAELRRALAADFHDEHGDRRQELVFIGIDMDEPTLRAGLERCLLTDAEMTGGPRAWAKLRDPLPALKEAERTSDGDLGLLA